MLLTTKTHILGVGDKANLVELAKTDPNFRTRHSNEKQRVFTPKYFMLR